MAWGTIDTWPIPRQNQPPLEDTRPTVALPEMPATRRAGAPFIRGQHPGLLPSEWTPTEERHLSRSNAPCSSHQACRPIAGIGKPFCVDPQAFSALCCTRQILVAPRIRTFHPFCAFRTVEPVVDDLSASLHSLYYRTAKSRKLASQCQCSLRTNKILA
jgi:hypothetical protein